MDILIFTLSLIFIFLNFLIYFFYYRHRPIGRSEKGIFLYQLMSLLILTTLTVLIVHDQNLEAFITAIIFSISIHGIYSLSFLEIWSLSEGGYSLQILDIIDRNMGFLPEESFNNLVKVGDEKKSKRINSLVKLNLIKVSGNYISLTYYGIIASVIVKSFRFLADIKKAG